MQNHQVLMQLQLQYQRHGRQLLKAADRAIDAGDAKAARDNLDSHEAMWQRGLEQGLYRPRHQFQSLEHLCASNLRRRAALLEAGQELPAKASPGDDAEAWAIYTDALEKSTEEQAPVRLDTGEVVRQDVRIAMARLADRDRLVPNNVEYLEGRGL